MSLFANPEAWLGLLTLTVLEIVLGIDNIIFISILAGKLPGEQQGRARRVGLAGAMVTRIALIAAVVLAVGVMMFAAAPISDFVHRHPTVKMLALSFLLMIGVSLIADGLGQHIAKGYIYFAMGFSVFVEMLNIRMRARTPPVKLREAYEGSFDTGGDEA